MIRPVSSPARGTAMPSAIVEPPHGQSAHELDRRGQAPRGHRHAREQATAADGHHQGVQVGVVGQHLQGAGPLPSDDRRVVEGVHVRPTLVPGQAQGLGLGLG
jgi:hypothetical protein